MLVDFANAVDAVRCAVEVRPLQQIANCFSKRF
jgi:hypothetical protein